MAKYTSDRQRKLKVGITSYTENLTVLEVTGGAYISSSVGIGTTNPSQSLHIQGNVRIAGGLYDNNNNVGTAGSILSSTGSGISWIAAASAGISTYADRAGIATYATSSGIATYATSSGIATYATSSGISTYATSSGIATYATSSGIATYATSSGIATYAPNAGIATYATNAGIATYAPNAGIATYAPNAGIATYATSSGIATYAPNAGIATYAPNAGIATYATSSGIATYATSSGIATYAPNAGISTNVIGGIASVTSLSVSVSGISTLGTVKISSGIVTSTNPGVSTVFYYGDGSGLINIKVSSIVGAIGYALTAGISTNVIGGIASVTSLSVSGISTLGTVLVSSGIVTATTPTGIVTYYGDGSKLTGIQTSGVVSVISQDPTVSSPVYPTLINNIGISSLTISTTKLSFIPSTNKLGVGTGTPRENLDVIGSIGIQSSGSSNRFYIQHNPSQSSLDFIFV
jgi:hypothetical protein